MPFGEETRLKSAENNTFNVIYEHCKPFYVCLGVEMVLRRD